jgi:hypothetical protein
MGSPEVALNFTTNDGGLSDDDLNRMLSLGLKAPGVNSFSNNGNIWIGEGGRFTLRVQNLSGGSIILVIWQGGSGWLNADTAKVTYSLQSAQTVSISVADGVEGVAFSSIYQDTHVEGQIYNTWGEFSVTQYSTIDVSREPWMLGNGLQIQPQSTGCRTNMNECVFVCKNNIDRCGAAGEYDLLNCDPNNNPGAQYGLANGQPSGGCSMGTGGDVEVNFMS